MVLVEKLNTGVQTREGVHSNHEPRNLPPEPPNSANQEALEFSSRGSWQLCVHLLPYLNFKFNFVNYIFYILRTGTIPAFLLLCTIVPIVKDNLGDIASSDNYRAIAIGSLLLKWFDWLNIILEGDKLETDELQFGFQAKSSTSQCTWAINTVIDHLFSGFW